MSTTSSKFSPEEKAQAFFQAKYSRDLTVNTAYRQSNLSKSERHNLAIIAVVCDADYQAKKRFTGVLSRANVLITPTGEVAVQ